LNKILFKADDLTQKDGQSFKRLRDIIDKLRGPDGCPWDKKQTHQSLKPYLVEESYEVLQAIDRGKSEKLCEELGDLLLQIMLHSRIADEAGEFNIDDVIDRISDKLIHRHPHVFGNDKTEDLDEIKHNWHSLKQEEKGKEGSILSGLPDIMPSLAHSQLIQRKVAEVGFDWEKPEDILEKLTEEMTELAEARNDEEKAAEFGDILFVLVNYARRLGIDSEIALRETNRKFYKRFTRMEEICRQRGNSFAHLSFDEQNALWEEAKKNPG
jgi:tetrapyrrole methylase family protein/MazG family protein